MEFICVLVWDKVGKFVVIDMRVVVWVYIDCNIILFYVNGIEGGNCVIKGVVCGYDMVVWVGGVGGFDGVLGCIGDFILSGLEIFVDFVVGNKGVGGLGKDNICDEVMDVVVVVYWEDNFFLGVVCGNIIGNVSDEIVGWYVVSMSLFLIMFWRLFIWSCLWLWWYCF